MDKALTAVESFLSHPILWGVIALVAFAVAFSGRLSVNAAVLVLWAAFGAAVFGVFRVEASLIRNDPLIKYLVLTLIASGLAIGTIELQRWFVGKSPVQSIADSKPKEVTSQSPPSAPTPAQELSGIQETLEEINKNLTRTGHHEISAAQMDAIKEVNQFIGEPDEMSLRKEFGFPEMMDTNIRSIIRVVKRDIRRA
jgi:hypothetical protein